MHQPKPKRSRLDKLFGTLLGVCATAVLISGGAWWLGWEYGPHLIVVFGALANVPMFHFAMHWPLRDSKKATSAITDQATPNSESPD
jgi:fatty acid desaturase